MSQIIVSGDDLNALVLKYLLEQGYKHAAFSLEHEAGLDVEKLLARRLPPRLLPSLLEQALLLRYLETHADQVDSSD
jgi:hypothetical protein